IHKTSQKSYTFTKIHILHIEFTKLHIHSLGGTQKITKIAIYIYIYIYTKKNQFKDPESSSITPTCCQQLQNKKNSHTFNKKFIETKKIHSFKQKKIIETK